MASEATGSIMWFKPHFPSGRLFFLSLYCVLFCLCSVFRYYIITIANSLVGYIVLPFSFFVVPQQLTESDVPSCTPHRRPVTLILRRIICANTFARFAQRYAACQNVRQFSDKFLTDFCRNKKESLFPRSSCVFIQLCYNSFYTSYLHTTSREGFYMLTTSAYILYPLLVFSSPLSVL